MSKILELGMTVRVRQSRLEGTVTHIGNQYIIVHYNKTHPHWGSGVATGIAGLESVEGEALIKEPILN